MRLPAAPELLLPPLYIPSEPRLDRVLEHDLLLALVGGHTPPVLLRMCASHCPVSGVAPGGMWLAEKEGGGTLCRGA
jgi:hypothetical protein